MRDVNESTVILIVMLCFALAACSRPPAVTISPPPAIPADRLAFEEGLSAVRESTPEGYKRAVEHFERASGLAPENCEYRMQAAQANLFLALEQRLNMEEFRPAWERGADPQCAPASAFALRLEAFRSLDDFGPGRDRAALVKINDAIQLEPENALNWFVRWKLNPSTTRQENAIVRAAEIAPDWAVIQYELGNYLLVEADYEWARQAFTRALELSPRHFRSMIGQAQAVSAIDDNEDVEHWYKDAVALAPDFLEGRILLGDYYAGVEENELARQQYLAALDENPAYEIAWLRIGLNYLQTAEIDEAERAFNQAIQINPSSYQAYYYRGNIWFTRSNLQKAREQYEEALKFVLNFPEAVYALGTVFYRQGNTDTAMEQFERVLRMNPSHADAYFSRAAVRVQRLQLREAIEDYNRALRLYENQWTLLTKSIEQYEDRALTRKAEAERKKKERLETIMERARQLKLKANELELGKNTRPTATEP